MPSSLVRALDAALRGLYPWVVDCAALRRRLAAVVLQHRGARGPARRVRGHHAVEGRRLAHKDAAITAVGAAGTVAAVIGTAAIVRRARRKNNS
jgi:hypothetical protein